MKKIELAELDEGSQKNCYDAFMQLQPELLERLAEFITAQGVERAITMYIGFFDSIGSIGQPEIKMFNVAYNALLHAQRKLSEQN